MAGFVYTTAVNYAGIVSAGDVGLVAAGASISQSVASAAGIYDNGGGKVIIAGSVVSGAGLGATFYGVGAGVLSVMASGSLYGTDGARFDNASSSYTVNNAGTIMGSGIGIYMSGTSARVMNTGDIVGDSATGVLITTSAGYAVTNAGTILGSNFGVLALGSGGTLLNSGVIAAESSAVQTGSGSDRVTNSGKILGRVELGDGADSFSGVYGLQSEVYGGAAADSLTGGLGAETLDGGADSDNLRGLGGEDRIYGQAGVDSLYGGADDDSLSGGAGADWLVGGAGEDLIYGGTEADRLTGGLGDDILSGGAAADTFIFAAGHGHDRVTDFADNVDKLDLRALDVPTLAALVAHSSNSALGLRIDLSDYHGGTILLTGMTVAKLTALDVIL